MSTEKLSDLERRVGSAEEQAAAARREIGALQDRAQRTLGKIGSFLAGAVFAVVGGYLAATVGAQGARNGVMTAPFYVNDGKGNLIFKVVDDDATGHSVGVFGTLAVRKPSSGAAVASISSTSTTAGLLIYSTATAPTGTKQIDATPVAFLGLSTSGGGKLELSKDGQLYVEAGVAPGDVGVVRALPPSGMTGGLGLPWAIMGKTK